MATNRVALITGANKGLGLEIARQLGQQGITVLIGARDEGRGRAAADRLRAEGIDARPVRLDVTDQGIIDAAPISNPCCHPPTTLACLARRSCPSRITGAGGAPPPSRSLHLVTSWPGTVRNPTRLHQSPLPP
jgi:hypothetical protein